MAPSEAFAEAFAARERGDWAAVRGALDTDADLSPEAQDALAEACWWMDDPQGAIGAWERSYTARLGADDNLGASRTAVRIAREYALAFGNEPATNGWLLRAGEALRDEGPCVEWGWIAICEAARASDPADAIEHANDALEAARTFKDRELEIYARGQIGIALVQQGHIDAGMDSFDAAMAAATGGESDDPRVLGDAFCGMIEACMTAADMSRTERWLEVFNDYMERYQHPPLLTFCSMCDAEAQLIEGRWSEAERTLDAALESLASGIRRARCVHPAALLAAIRVDQSRFEEADQLLTGLEDLPEMAEPRARLFLARGEPAVAIAGLRRRLNALGPDNVLASPLLALLVEAELARGDRDAAETASANLAELASGSEREQDRAVAELAAGRIARSEGDGESAREHLDRGLDLFAKHSMPLQVARSHFELALVARDDEPDVAAEEARVALTTFDEIGSVRDADLAARLLRDLGAGTRPGPKDMEQLTRREREVLALLGQGLTNAEIAARLFISTKTAGHHVSNILAKLGMRNRSEAGAYAQRFLAEK
ncbi:MAG: LuxR C-terminal-related transcriptional regulator [Actinomycetota bacterium]